MSKSIRSSAEAALNKIRGHLSWYANNRGYNFVGQFLDSEGCSNRHHGVYGMSGWIVLSSESTDTRVAAIRDDCKCKLMEWVDQSNKPGEPKPESEAYELKYITSKICYAYMALRLYPGSSVHASHLQDRLFRSQRASDYSWGCMTNSADGSPFFTAMVLRTFADSKSFSQKSKINAINYLMDSIKNIHNIYHRLYALNAVQRLRSSLGHRSVRDDIVQHLNQVYRSINDNPINFVNPTNVDFNDVGRTRYFRIGTDLILLESLISISNDRFNFIQAHRGRRMFSSLTESVNTSVPTSDTSGHRASIGNYYFAHDLFRLILSKEPVNSIETIDRLRGWFRSYSAFGFDFSWNLLILFISALTAIVLVVADADSVWRVLVSGISLKALVDVGKNLYES